MNTARSARSNEGVREEREPGSGHHQVAPKRPTEQREQASVQRYLDRVAEAMTSGDTRTMTTLWGVPAFVIGQSEARVVQSEAEVEQLFEGSKDKYNERGIMQTRAEIQHLDWVGPDLVVATVRWPYLGEQDQELGEESSSYTLLRGEDGSYKLRSILMRGARGPGVACADGTDGE
jgi:hypothetical protein